MSKLDKEIAAKIELLSNQGDQFLDDGNFTEAHQSFLTALQSLPEPVEDWEEATWLFAALGDVYYFSENFELAFKAFNDAVVCPEGLGNPFIHLRLGECAFELNDLPRATEELNRAYASDGEEIFAEEDPKYLEFLRTKMN